MTKDQTQEQFIVNKLLDTGGISRNWCVNLPVEKRITRLSHYMTQVLPKKGWEFETVKHKGNYIYLVTKCPLKAVEYRVGDRIIIKYEPT